MRPALLLAALLMLASPALAAKAVPLGCSETLGEEQASRLLGRWDLAELNPAVDPTLQAPEQALFVPSAEIDRQVAALAAANSIPDNDLEASRELMAAVANATASAYSRKSSSVFVLSANPATNLAVGVNVYQDEGQPLQVVHMVGVACPLADGSIDWQVWNGNGMMRLRFSQEDGKDQAAMGVFNANAGPDADHVQPWAFYASPLIKADKSFAELLPELAELLRAANATSA